MTVTRPISFDTSGGGFPALSEEERRQLQEENGPRRFGLRDLGKPGSEVLARRLRRGHPTQLPASTVSTIAAWPASQARRAGSRSTRSTSRAPCRRRPSSRSAEASSAARGGPQVVGPRNVDIDAITVSGVDQTNRELGAITPGQISSGRYFTDSDTREAVLDTGHASRKGITVGETSSSAGSRSP